MEGLRQKDLLRQMFRIERAELAQGFHNFSRDPLGFPIFRSPVDHAVPHGGQCALFNFFLDPVHQNIHRRRMIGRFDGPSERIRALRSLDRKTCARKADAFNSSGQKSTQRFARFK